MSPLLLIRHGENDFTKKHRLAGHLPNIHLNDRGNEQARALGDALKEIELKAIYSSPLERCIETAEPIARMHGLEIKLDQGLIETKVGKWQGRYHARLRMTRAWKIVQSAPSRFEFPDGESFHQCQERVVRTLDAIHKKHKPTDMVACVFHADPIKLAVAFYLGMPLDNFQRLSCDTGSITFIQFHEFHTRLIKLNQRPPLDFS